MKRNGRKDRQQFMMYLFKNHNATFPFSIIIQIQTTLMGPNRISDWASSTMRVTCHIKDASCLLLKKSFLKDGHTDVNAKGTFWDKNSCSCHSIYIQDKSRSKWEDLNAPCSLRTPLTVRLRVIYWLTLFCVTEQSSLATWNICCGWASCLLFNLCKETWIVHQGIYL